MGQVNIYCSYRYHLENLFAITCRPVCSYLQGDTYFRYSEGVRNPGTQVQCLSSYFYSVLFFFLLLFSLSFISLSLWFPLWRGELFYKPISSCLYRLIKNCKPSACLSCVVTRVPGKGDPGSWGKPTLCFGPCFR